MDIDVTLLLQFGLISLLVLILRPLLMVPLLHVIDERHSQTHGLRHDVRRMERLAAADRDAYEAKMLRARHEVHQRREGLRQTGRDRARAIEAAARTEAQQSMLVHRAVLAEGERAAYQTLSQQTPGRATALVARLLGREVSP